MKPIVPRQGFGILFSFVMTSSCFACPMAVEARETARAPLSTDPDADVRQWLQREVHRVANAVQYFRPDRRPIDIKVTLQPESVLLDLDASFGDLVGGPELDRFEHMIASEVVQHPRDARGHGRFEWRIGGHGAHEWAAFPPPVALAAGAGPLQALRGMTDAEVKALAAQLEAMAAAAVDASDYVSRGHARVSVSLDRETGRIVVDVVGASVDVEDDVGQEHLAMALRYGLFPILSRIPDIRGVSWRMDGTDIY